MKISFHNFELKYKFEKTLLIIIAVLASACATNANPAQTAIENNEEIINELIKIGPDVTFHDTTTLSESKIQYFCLGQQIHVEISTRQNLSDEETYINHTVTASLNGSPLGKEEFTSIQIQDPSGYTFIIPTFNCLDDKIILYIMGYNDGDASSGKLIDTLEANLNL